MPAEQGREIEAGADVAPGWNVALARRASAVAGSWRGAIKWAAIAATVWIGGLQLQAWRLERGVAELRAHVHGRVQQAFPALARVTDPLRQVRQQLQGGPGQSEFAFLLGAATQHLAFATGEVAGLRYADGALDVEMAPGARRDPAPEGARRTGSRRRQGRRIRRAASRRLAPAPRAATGRGTREPLMSFAFRPLAAAPFAAGRKRIADWRARAGNYWLGLAPRERRMLAGCALLALAALCWLALIEPALARAERARAELTRLRGLSIELETLLASAPREQTARGPATEASLRLGLEQAGLQADVTAPGQDGRWRLSLDDARAEPLLRWLLTQPGRLSLRPDRIDLRRIDAPAAAGSRPAVTVLEVPGKGAVSPTGMSLLDQYRASIELSPPPGTRGNTVTQYRLPQAARTTARRKVVSMAVLAALAGCSTPDGGRRADAPQTGLDGLPPLAMTLAPTAQARATPAPEAARAQPLRTAQASRAVGGDKRAAPLSAQADAGQKTSDTPAANVPPGKPAAAAQEGVLLNFVDADIPAVLRVLAKFTGKRFLVDPRVKGTLTLVSQAGRARRRLRHAAGRAAHAGLRGGRRGRRHPCDAGSRRQAAGRAGAKRRRAGGRRRGHADLPPEL